MGNDRHLTDADIARLLTGNHEDPVLDGVAAWVDAVQNAADSPIDPSVASAHVLAAVAERAQSRAAQTSASTGLLYRSRKSLRRMTRTTFAKVAAIAVAFALATGGVAAAGVLPDAVQDPVADAYGLLGFDFPSSNDDEEIAPLIDEEDDDAYDEADDSSEADDDADNGSEVDDDADEDTDDEVEDDADDDADDDTDDEVDDDADDDADDEAEDDEDDGTEADDDADDEVEDDADDDADED